MSISASDVGVRAIIFQVTVIQDEPHARKNYEVAVNRTEWQARVGRSGTLTEDRAVEILLEYAKRPLQSG